MTATSIIKSEITINITNSHGTTIFSKWQLSTTSIAYYIVCFSFFSQTKKHVLRAISLHCLQFVEKLSSGS